MGGTPWTNYNLLTMKKNLDLIQNFQKFSMDLDSALIGVEKWKRESCDNSMEAVIPSLELNLTEFLGRFNGERIPELVADKCIPLLVPKVMSLLKVLLEVTRNFRLRRNNSQTHRGVVTMEVPSMEKLARQAQKDWDIQNFLGVEKDFYGVEIWSSVGALLRGNKAAGDWPYFSTEHLKICMLMLEMGLQLLSWMNQNKLKEKDVLWEQAKKGLSKLNDEEVDAITQLAAQLVQGEYFQKETALEEFQKLASELRLEGILLLKPVDREVLKEALAQMIDDGVVTRKLDFEVFHHRISEICAPKMTYANFLSLLKEMDIPQNIRPASESILKNLNISRKFPDWKIDSKSQVKREKIIHMALRFSECYLNLLAQKC